MNAPVNGAEMLARIQPTLRQQRTQICLRPDLIDEWERANELLANFQMEDAKARVSDTPSKGQRVGSNDSAATKAQAQVVLDLEAAIEDASPHFVFEAMIPDKWQALVEKHGPRKGDELDLYSGYNRQAVLDQAVADCMVDPVFDAAGIAQLRASISAGEWEELRESVRLANGAVGGPPKSLAASEILSKPAATSRQRKRGA